MSTLTEVGNFYDPEEAYCAWGYLNANGVHAIIQNEYHLTAAPWMRVALGVYRLLAQIEKKNEAEALFVEIDRDARREQRDREIILPSPPYEEPRLKKGTRNWAWVPIALWMAIPFVPKYRHSIASVVQFAMLIAFYAVIGLSARHWILYWR